MSEDSQILDAISKWLERDVRPKVRELERRDEYPEAMVEQMKAFGLFGTTIAPRYGGLGLSARTYARIVTLISEVWIALPGAFNTHLIMAALVERFGTEAQKAHFLPRFASAELCGGLALTEADGGTDLQAIRTRAVRAGDQYVINGAKTWITNAIEGSCFALLVKTAPDAEPRHRGMSLFLAEKGPGFRVGRRLEKLGYHGSDTAELFFKDYRVPEDRLIGGSEGHGFVQVMAGLELGRINVAARGVGLANAALKDSLRYAQMRTTFGKPITQHQTIQLKLAEMATRRSRIAAWLTRCWRGARDLHGRNTRSYRWITAATAISAGRPRPSSAASSSTCGRARPSTGCSSRSASSSACCSAEPGPRSGVPWGWAGFPRSHGTSLRFLKDLR